MAMVKRTSFANDDCPIARSLDAIGDWWSMLIIRDALFGARRFGEFQKNLGLAKNILAVRLRALLDQDILKMAARLRRQRLSGIPADAERPRRVSGTGRAAAVERGIRRSTGQNRHGPGRQGRRPAGSQARTLFPGWPAVDRSRYRAKATAGRGTSRASS
jgi:hypothetical protein